MPSRLPLLLALLLTGGAALCPDMAMAASPARAGSESSRHEHGVLAGHRYTIDLTQVPLDTRWTPLRQALDNYAASQRSAFLDKVKNAPPSRLPAPWKLSVDFSVAAHSDRFVSVVAFGDIEPGGASPSAIIDSFTYDTKAEQMISLSDLFDDFAPAEAALAANARAQLLAKLKPGKHHRPLASDAATVRNGTEPGKERLRMFVPIVRKDHQAHGLSLIFPSHQVAADTAGPQDVDVPTAAFARWLKPEYRDAFH
ncbi:hypothetical protein [Dyella subtropica]|uniref:hypothetical protein n=1 Tax=Dyella subtropica TaxID=2992127 RepID=UPI00224EF629|nr:hypothetical protein [Dyella subtropica]